MIIAEIGQNFVGDIGLAEHLISEAYRGGADLAKFQLYDSKKLYGEYQDTELTFPQARGLFEYGEKTGIEVFFSVFDVERVKWCEKIGVKRIKVACNQLGNNPLLEKIGGTGKHVIVSCRVTPPPLHTDLRMVSFLYCIPHYPAQYGELLFDKIGLGSSFHGFSDHTIGLDASKIALSRGAEIIEKHFAINHQTGVDAPWSMTFEELRELARFSSVVKQVL